MAAINNRTRNPTSVIALKFNELIFFTIKAISIETKFIPPVYTSCYASNVSCLNKANKEADAFVDILHQQFLTIFKKASFDIEGVKIKQQ